MEIRPFLATEIGRKSNSATAQPNLQLPTGTLGQQVLQQPERMTESSLLFSIMLPSQALRL